MTYLATLTLAVFFTCQIVAAQTVNNPSGTWQRKNFPWPLTESDSGTIGSKTGEHYKYIDYYWTLSPPAREHPYPRSQVQEPARTDSVPRG